MAAVYRLGSGWFAPSVDCAINGFMHSAPARLVIWLSEANGGGAGAIFLN
jgi:hypothetical protein